MGVDSGGAAAEAALCSGNRQNRKEKEGKRRKNPVLDTVGSIATLFWITPLSNNGRGRARAAFYGVAGR